MLTILQQLPAELGARYAVELGSYWMLNFSPVIVLSLRRLVNIHLANKMVSFAVLLVRMCLQIHLGIL
jgi:hypothetical protein